MKLFVSPNSPYARKCRVILREKNLAGIEEIAVNAMENPPELLAVNPLGTVPAMVTPAASSRKKRSSSGLASMMREIMPCSMMA